LAIITYFKILPTDDRYRNLNLAQKLVILSAIGDYYGGIGDLINVGFKRIDSYFGGGTESNDEYVHENAFFEQQSYIGKQTGKMQSPPALREAIEEFYESEKKRAQQESNQETLG